MNVSVIMPVFNEAANIEQTLQTIVASLDQGDELIVVDGGSTDSTGALLERMSTITRAPECNVEKIKVVNARKGRANQMNAGARLASKEILLFLHADTELSKECVEELREATQAVAPGVRFWGRFDVRIVGKSRWLPMVAWFMNRRSKLTRVCTGDQAIFLSKSLFQRIGGYFDQPLMEDIELCKTLNTQPDVFFLPLAGPVITSGRRWDTEGVWSTIVLMWQFRYRYWRGASAYDLARKYKDIRLTQEAKAYADNSLAGLECGTSQPKLETKKEVTHEP